MRSAPATTGDSGWVNLVDRGSTRAARDMSVQAASGDREEWTGLLSAFDRESNDKQVV